MVEFASPFFEKSGLSARIKPVIGPAAETMQQLAKQGKRYEPVLLALFAPLAVSSAVLSLGISASSDQRSACMMANKLNQYTWCALVRVCSAKLALSWM